MKDITNQQAARVLAEIGEYLAMQAVPFKPRAYEKAAQAVADMEQDIKEVYARGGPKALMDIPGVGASIAKKLEELLRTGKIAYYEKIKKQAPVRLDELTRIEGLGPKSILKLYRELGIRDLKDLEKAAKTGKIAKLKGFGERSEENILKGLGFAKTQPAGRKPLGYVEPQISELTRRLAELPGVEKCVVAGSVRRRKETIGDVDIIIVSDQPKRIMDSFVAMASVLQVLAHGETKSSVKLAWGLNADLRVVPARSFGAALNYFTGSKDHNVVLRQMALARGWKLNEYGLYKRKEERGKRKAREGEKREWTQIAGRDEEGIYEALGLQYVPPELRENTGEIELARAGKLPKLVEYDALQGDLQVQSDWGDGQDSIEAMARAAMAHGLRYIAITDHSQRLAMARGLDEQRLLKQMAEIDRLNRKFRGKMTILKGSECDILKDGSMDLPARALAKLDVVGGSIHSFFGLPRREQTERMLRAIRNPDVDLIFHPTGRLIGRRAGCDLDLDAIIRAAKATGTVLEIDSFPDRLDLRDEHIRKAIWAGVRLAVDSDAHSTHHFSYLKYGLAQARRGSAAVRDIINTRPLPDMLKCLKKK